MLRALAGNAHIAVEGEAEPLGTLDLLSLPGARKGPSALLERDYGTESLMVILPLETRRQAERLYRVLVPDTQVAEQVGAIQIERNGRVEFLAGDRFHRECVSVGPAVVEKLLRQLARRRVIRGFYTPAEVRKHFQDVGDDV
jgi:hypothetical protein